MVTLACMYPGFGHLLWVQNRRNTLKITRVISHTRSAHKSLCPMTLFKMGHFKYTFMGRPSMSRDTNLIGYRDIRVISHTRSAHTSVCQMIHFRVISHTRSAHKSLCQMTHFKKGHFKYTFMGRPSMPIDPVMIVACG